MLLNFGDRTRTRVFNMVWPLTKTEILRTREYNLNTYTTIFNKYPFSYSLKNDIHECLSYSDIPKISILSSIYNLWLKSKILYQGVLFCICLLSLDMKIYYKVFLLFCCVVFFNGVVIAAQCNAIF